MISTEIHNDIDRARAASRFLDRVVERHSAWVAEGGLIAARHSGDMAAEIKTALAEVHYEAGVMRVLRIAREREMARIACRDLCKLAELDETLGDLSELAEVCLRASLDFALTQLRQRYGEPRDESGALVQPVVLGMGKLGGRELNFSSDIDLIFCHTAAGETDGASALDNAEFFKRAAQLVTRLLSERTEHGFVFRVDLMLRPFGSVGPVSIAFDAAEDYYQQHGREWERYAFVKARPVAGDIEAGLEFLRALRPFVYRRYLDFNAIGSLRALKKLIADDVARRRQDDNVKLGTGGIRELEFIAQSFQLVRGGQEAPLRDTQLRPVLRRLGQSGYLSAEIAQTLDEHYVFLRRLENAIQMYADEQTHSLPQNEDAQKALCNGLGFADWDALATRFTAVRTQVHEEFRRIFAEPDQQQAEEGLADWLLELWNEPDGQPIAHDVTGFGDDAAAVTKAVRDLRDSRSVRSLTPASQERLQALLPLLIEEAQRQSEPALALTRTLAVVQAIGGRSTYLTLLRESAIARDHLVKLCAASPWVSQLLASNPALLDALLDTRSLYAPPDRDGIKHELADVLAHIPAIEVEAGMDALRRFRLETTLRIAACDVAGTLPLVQVSDRLTWLAEAVLHAAFDRAYDELSKTYGEPLRADDTRAGLCALAYGKFGGIELGYGSDLDLVFIHDCDAPDRETVGGERVIAGSIFMVRWAQRVIHWLATLTPAGRAYEIDLELRPSGRSGLAVVSVEGFSEYQRREAWTWEHQALTRARPVAGSAAIAARLDALRRDVLCQPRDAEKLRADIHDMRAKMRAKLERREAGCWDVKQGEGGLIDIEFITQYLLLREAPRVPALVEYSDNWRQLEALTVAGVIAADDRDALIQVYRQLRAWSHARGLQQQPVMSTDDAFRSERERVKQIWASVGL
jgi:glutamate-ammonia-ligase adenylyltransferase